MVPSSSNGRGKPKKGKQVWGICRGSCRSSWYVTVRASVLFNWPSGQILLFEVGVCGTRLLQSWLKDDLRRTRQRSLDSLSKGSISSPARLCSMTTMIEGGRCGCANARRTRRASVLRLNGAAYSPAELVCPIARPRAAVTKFLEPANAQRFAAVDVRAAVNPRCLFSYRTFSVPTALLASRLYRPLLPSSTNTNANTKYSTEKYKRWN